MNDDELNELIRGASPPPDFPTSFQREVWQRIAVSESKSFRSTLSRFASGWLYWMVRPAGAAVTVVTMLIIGAGLGGVASHKLSDSDLKAAYAASINPLRSAHSSEE